MKSNFFVVIVVAMAMLVGCYNVYDKSQSGLNYENSHSNVLTNPPSQSFHPIVTFTVIGKGVQPGGAITKGQAIYLAEKAAIIDGYRLLAEKLKGVYIDAYSRESLGIVSHDILESHVNTLIRGINIKKISLGEYGIVEAVMELRVKFTRYGMIWWPAGLSQDSES